MDHFLILERKICKEFHCMNIMAGEKFIVSVLVVVVAGLLLYFLIGAGGSGTGNGILNHPNPILIASYNNEVCPSLINFYEWEEDGESFTIPLRNSGSEGGLFMNISSNDILIKPDKTTGVFNNYGEIRWNVISGNQQDFKFKLKRNDTNLDNFSIGVSYGCNGLLCPSYTFCCNYNKSSKWYNNNEYVFVSQSC